MGQYFLSIEFILGLVGSGLRYGPSAAAWPEKFRGPELYQDRRLPLEPQLLELLKPAIDVLTFAPFRREQTTGKPRPKLLGAVSSP
jgi:hypothetical protein